MPNKIIPYNPALKEHARRLRKESTLAEIALWLELKNKSLDYEFHRQVPIDNFIVDFYCHELMLAIEIDGGSHQFEEVAVNDIRRQERLESFGITFIRFTEKDVRRDRNQVLRKLREMIEHLTSE